MMELLIGVMLGWIIGYLTRTVINRWHQRATPTRLDQLRAIVEHDRDSFYSYTTTTDRRH
jgi:hypothetical protein